VTARPVVQANKAAGANSERGRARSGEGRASYPEAPAPPNGRSAPPLPRIMASRKLGCYHPHSRKPSKLRG
jgi:hypothetical protein